MGIGTDGRRPKARMRVVNPSGLSDGGSPAIGEEPKNLGQKNGGAMLLVSDGDGRARFSSFFDFPPLSL
jgi:hypothetical protein